MSTTPPQPDPAGPTTPRGEPVSATGAGPPQPFATLPIPGNAELVVYVLVLAVIGIITLTSDEVGAGAFVTATTVLTAAYVISRGIAKASRVFEH